jgi:hypothetical protein
MAKVDSKLTANLTPFSDSVMDLRKLIEQEIRDDPEKEAMYKALLAKVGDKKVLTGEFKPQESSDELNTDQGH